MPRRHGPKLFQLAAGNSYGLSSSLLSSCHSFRNKAGLTMLRCNIVTDHDASRDSLCDYLILES